MNEIFHNSTHLDRVETTIVAWFHKAHPTMTHKPTLQRQLNELLQEVELTDEESRRIEKAQVPGYDGKTAPPIFLSTRTPQIGQDREKVASDAVGITCYRAHFNIMTELLFRIPRERCPYDIVPVRLPQIDRANGINIYKQLLMSNNDHNQNLFN